jgi:hypothetical protein
VLFGADIISGLLASSSTQVLLNGVPGEVIFHRQGPRQGDLLSTYALYISDGCTSIWWQRPRPRDFCNPLQLGLCLIGFPRMRMMLFYSFDPLLVTLI